MKLLWPKILYIHIAKTGGSSVNEFISSHFSPEEVFVHVESSPGWYKNILNKERVFISGHIYYPVFKELLGSLDGYLKVVTLRNPIQHVISHLAWVRHLSDPEGKARFRFDSHPKPVQEMSLKLAKINLGDPIHISKFISEMNNFEYNLMDNTQTRYLSKITPGAYVSDSNLYSAKKNLEEFEVIGITTKMDDFFKFLSTKVGWETPALSSIPKVNRLSNKYGMDSNDEKLVTALMPLIRYDMELYDSLDKII
jgi:hypothetical protein